MVKEYWSQDICESLRKLDLKVRLFKLKFTFMGYYIGMKKLMFVYNPVSGKMDVSRNLSEIVEVFSKDYLVEIHATGRKGDGYKYISLTFNHNTCVHMTALCVQVAMVLCQKLYRL